MRKKLVLIFSFLFCTQLFAAKYYRFTYYVENNDDFARVVKRFTNSSATVDARDNMIKRTQQKNPQISDWKNLNKGQEFKLYVLPKKADYNEIRSYIKAHMKPKLKKKLKERKFKRDDKLSIFGFLTTSEGTFEEELASKVKLSSSQFSPITVGGGIAYKIKNHRGSISSSVYWSKLVASSIEGSTDTVEVPNELGITLYYEYLFEKFPLIPYGGLDFESFTTFNLKELSEDSTASPRALENNIWWLTLGLTKFLPTKRGGFLFKASFSKSVAESSTASVPYEGIKYILYANWKPGKKLLYHVLWKTHKLEGETVLTVNRIGLGLGWTFK